MFERMATGWQLARQSWRVLMLDKELLVFPLLSGIACVMVMASFAVPLWSTGFVDQVAAERAAGDGGQFHQIVGIVVLFAYYFVNYFVIVFFNSALIACAIIRFKGATQTCVTAFRPRPPYCLRLRVGPPSLPQLVFCCESSNPVRKKSVRSWPG